MVSQSSLPFLSILAAHLISCPSSAVIKPIVKSVFRHGWPMPAAWHVCVAPMKMGFPLPLPWVWSLVSDLLDVCAMRFCSTNKERPEIKNKYYIQWENLMGSLAGSNFAAGLQIGVGNMGGRWAGQDVCGKTESLYVGWSQPIRVSC